MQKSTIDIANSFSMYNDFMQDYERTLKHNQRFGAIMSKIMKEEFAYEFLDDHTLIKRKITNKIIFQRVTKLSTSVYDRITAKEGNNDYIPSMVTLMTLCVVYSLDMPMVITLLDSLGLRFKRTNVVHHAYCYLIANCRGKSIDDCNKVLQELNIDKKYHLGYRTTKTV